MKPIFENPIANDGLIVILRDVPNEKMIHVAHALYDGGVRILEIAFKPDDPDTTAGTAAKIRAVRDSFGEKLFVGAGTVVEYAFLEAAIEAGAQFIFSPDTNPDIIRCTKESGLISIPGAFTPTEMALAWRLGADIVKFFPTTVNDLGYIINVVRPLSHIPFICVGGVTDEMVVDSFFAAGALGVGTGLSIVSAGDVVKEDYESIRIKAAAHVAAVQAARSKYGRR